MEPCPPARPFVALRDLPAGEPAALKRMTPMAAGHPDGRWPSSSGPTGRPPQLRRLSQGALRCSGNPASHTTCRETREICRRADVVSISPDHPSVIRLVGAVLAKQLDECLTAERR